MKNYSFVFFLLLNLPYCSTFPQSSVTLSDSTDTMYEEGAEILLQDIDSDSEDSDFMDYLDDLRRHPVDLNSSTKDQLTSVPLITSAIAERIIDYRNIHSSFSSKRELLKIDGINEQIYSQVSQYLVARKKNKCVLKIKELNKQDKKFSADFRSLFIQDLLPKSGFITGKYMGSRLRNANRLRLYYNANSFILRSGIVTDKDPGETSYADFLSGHISYQGNGVFKNITIGDYQLSFGNGLTLGNSYSSPKSFETSSGKRRARSIYPYSSSGEFSFFRGVVVNVELNGFNAYGFFSKRSLDASIDTMTNEVRSIYSDGYHRTYSEISRKNAFAETVFGGRLEFIRESLRIGSTVRFSKYSLPLSRDTVKKLYGVFGEKSSAAGIDFQYRNGSLNTFGEASLSNSGSVAFYGGVSYTAGSAADLIFSFRKFPFDFAPAHNSSFGERNTSENETGFFAGLRLTPVKKLSITAYFDQYASPYRTYFNPTPARGKDFLAGLEYRTSNSLIMNLRFRSESKEELSNVVNAFGKDIQKLIPRNQKNVRVGITYGKKGFRIRSRYEYCLINYSGFVPSGKGQLFYTDISSKLFRHLNFSARVIYFQTDNYDSRIYEFENDISGVMTNPALYGKGMRWYLITRYRPLPDITLEAKYSETFFNGVKKIGSGNDEISGDILNRLSLSMEAVF